MGNDKRRKRTLSTQTIIDLYEQGLSTEEIGVKANVSARYVRMLLNKNNVMLRPHGSWKRKYSVNEDYFKTWSNNMAYILGFFFADGMVARDAQIISFSQKEKGILENIRDEMQSNHPIIQNKDTGVYILNINSKIMRTDLITLYDLMPNKARQIKFLQVPKQYLSHFIRGYFDGDGHVKYEKYFVNIVGGSKQFMLTLRDHIENAGFKTKFVDYKTDFRVYVSGRKTLKQFSNWLYKNKGLYLMRKYNIFMQEKLSMEQLEEK